MRMIDADALINEAMERYCSDCERRKGVKNGKFKIIYSVGDAPCRACGIGDMIDELEDAPTIEERKTGKWIRRETDLMRWYVCSECGAKPLYDEYRTGRVFSAYCPNCGASMIGGEQR